jgi:hypothetical protein
VFYNGVANTGIQNNVGYLSAELQLMTLEYTFFEFLPVPLCFYNEKAYEFQQEVEGEDGSRRLSDNDYANCPNDGSYPFLVTYTLPSAGKGSRSWLASGWSGNGYLRLYAAENENMLIGECQMTVSTYVTKQSSSSSGFFDTPSAAMVAGITIGSLAALLLLCCSCYCCCRRQYRESKKVSLSEDHVTSFRRMTSHDGAPDELTKGEKTLLA